MKKLLLLILVLLILSACGVEEEPVIEKTQSEEEVYISEDLEKETTPGRVVCESKNELEKFEATDINQIQLFNDNYAYVNGLNNEVILGEFCKTTISGYNLETDEAEILFSGEAYFDYIDLLHVREMDFSNPWIFNYKYVLSKGIVENSDFEYYLGGMEYEGDLDFVNKRYVYTDRNDRSKLRYKSIETGSDEILYDVSDEGENYFIYYPKVNSDTGNIIFMVCDYIAYNSRKLVCLDYWGNVIFEQEVEEIFRYDLRWLNDEEFALFISSPDDRLSKVIIYNINNGIKFENDLNFYYFEIQNDMVKSYPYALFCEDVPKAYYRYRLWLYNFEDGTAEEIYISPTKGVIRGFDLSPSGKTVIWVENDDIKYIRLQ